MDLDTGGSVSPEPVAGGAIAFVNVESGEHEVGFVGDDGSCAAVTLDRVARGRLRGHCDDR